MEQSGLQDESLSIGVFCEGMRKKRGGNDGGKGKE